MSEQISEEKSIKIYRGLSLDGGGSRGLFSLDLLTLMAKNERIKHPTQPFSSKFDIIVALSVGGIIGAAIAVGIFDDETKRNNLISDGKQIFGAAGGNPFLQPVYTGFEKATLLSKNFGKLKMKDCKVKLIIVCTTITFAPIFYKSWLPEHSELYLSEVLNATSAAPYFFPPAYVGKSLFWDGGMYLNCPIDLTILELKKLFNPGKKNQNFEFRILSIGTKLENPSLKEEPKIEDPNGCGLLVLFQLGIVKAIGGSYNTLSAELRQYEYGDKVILRLTSELDPKFDDVTDEYQAQLRSEAERVYTKNRIEVEEFFHDFVTGM
jgi:patatin-like phospholipase